MLLFDKLHIEKKRVIQAVICAVILGLALMFFYYCKGKNEFYMSMVDKLIIAGCSAVSVLLVLFKRKLNNAVACIGEAACILTVPVLLYKKLEPLVNDMERLVKGSGFYNWLIIMAIFLALYGLFQNAGIVILAGGGAVYVFYIIDYFTLSFRGSPVLFSDILSAKTAAGVSGKYNYVLNDTMVTAFFELAMLACIGFYFGRRKKIKERIFIGAASLAAGVAVFSFLVLSDITVKKGFRNSAFVPVQSAGENGLLLNCVVNMHLALLPEPEGYSAARVNDIIDKNTVADRVTESEGLHPNIIVIMNESFTDLDYLETVRTTEDTIPFFKSLRGDSISGTLISSILGGNTPNSEFEFLTGCSMAFLPTGMVAYQQLISRDLPTVATMLRDEGFDTIAEHIYRPEYFDRNRIYPFLGINRFITEDNYSRDDVVVNYSRDNTGYADDASCYTILEKEFSRKASDQKQFWFCVTIQNHGGYWTGMDGISVIGQDDPYSTEYVSLLKMSDDAFKDFIEYFESVDEPTIVCMYGDHQPYLFADDACPVWDGYDYTDEEKRYMQAKVPFIIWANYDIEACDMGEMSINYLGPTLLKAAGMPMSDFFWYLDELRETLPVISAVGYVDNKGNHYTDADTSPYKDLIREYEILQYNYLKGNIETDFYK